MGSIRVLSLLAQANFKIPSRSTRSQVPIHSINYTVESRNPPIDRMMRLGNEDPAYLLVHFNIVLLFLLLYLLFSFVYVITI